MKSFLTIALITAGISSAHAFNCHKNICPNDKVISRSGFVGNVIGINPNNNNVSVHWTQDTNGYSKNFRETLDFTSLYITKGCYRDLCLGDIVFSQSGYVGEVVAHNQFQDKVSVHWTQDTNGYSKNFREAKSVESLSVENSCMLGICDKDKVISPSGYEGKVVGINKSLSSATVHWTKDTNGYSKNFRELVSLDKLSVARGCLLGICIGDGVFSPSGYEGTVLGFNRSNNKAAIHWTKDPNGYSKNFRETKDIASLAVSNYCIDFSESERYGRRDRPRRSDDRVSNHSRNDDQVRGNAQDRLGFSFRDRALMIAEVVIETSRQLEPYLNNDQERKIDEIKKQALRLSSRINGGREIKVVRNTLYYLGELLDDSSEIIDRALETDRLSGLAEDYMTSYESIKTMVRFLDNDFQGQQVDLY